MISIGKMGHKIAKYTPTKIGKCPKCKQTVIQYLFDYNYAIYKCSKCSNIHPLK